MILDQIASIKSELESDRETLRQVTYDQNFEEMYYWNAVVSVHQLNIESLQRQYEETRVY